MIFNFILQLLIFGKKGLKLIVIKIFKKQIFGPVCLKISHGAGIF